MTTHGPEPVLQQPPRGLRGFGMIDILISMLLLGVTLGGAFYANSAGLKELRFLNRTSVAMDATKEMIIRMNRNLRPTTVDIYQINSSTILHSPTDCLSGCNPTELAQNDVYQWTQRVLSEIPGAKLKITITPPKAILGILWPTTKDKSLSTDICPFSPNEQADHYCLAFESVAHINE